MPNRVERDPCERRRSSDLESIPAWAQRERATDLVWILNNSHVLKPAAKEQNLIYGRGALVVDTTVQPDPTMGHPIWYLPLEALESLDELDVQWMVGRYDPEEEMVIVLLKPEDRQSSYRVVFSPLQP